MFPYKTSIILDRNSKQPLYLQLSNQFILLIKERILPPKTKLLGSRTLSEQIGVHRKTVVACYEELMLQGWVESIPQKGTFVHSCLPELISKDFEEGYNAESSKSVGFSFYKNEILNSSLPNSNTDYIYANDGISDGRLTPINELARTYRRITAKKNVIQHLSYGTTYGNSQLRDVLVKYLHETRGLKISRENILITRGSQMGIYLSAQLLVKNKDVIIVGETNYSAADNTFKYHNANIKRVSVDENGLSTNDIAQYCKKHNVKAVYVTSHHHHPTTVTLSAERRIHLLNLAKRYKFAIIEDDYDYDFNYNHAPILPLASHDTNGNVIYIGSVCKTVAPVFRVGYLIASKEFVDEGANLRRIIDRQGDALLELTFADFIKSGDLDRHIKKVMKVYKARRDLFCKLLKSELSYFFKFEVPKGGMAVWVTLDNKYSWDLVEKIAFKNKLIISDWKRYDLSGAKHNAIRIGFANYTKEEIIYFIEVLKKTMFEMLKKTHEIKQLVKYKE